MANTLYDFYTGQGKALPSLTERAKIAQQYGIQGYQGTAQQNTQLLGFLQKPPQAPAPLTSSLTTTPQSAPTTGLTRVPTQGIDQDGQPIYDVFAGTEHIKTPSDPRLTGVNITQLPVGQAPQGFQSQFNAPQGITPQTLPPPPVSSTPPPSLTQTYEKSIAQNMAPSVDEQQTQEQLDNLLTSRDLGVAKIKDQPIPMDFITGQSSSVLRNAAIQAETLEQKLARLQAQRQTSLDVSKYQLEREDAKTAQAKADARYEKEFAADEAYRTASLNQVKPSSQPSSVQEYEYAKKNGYTGSYNDYQTLDANRKASIARAGASNASGLTNYQEVTALNGIIGKYNSSPLIQASDRTPVLEASIQKIKANPSDAAQQLNLSYAYVQALDTYQSAVREGELNNLNSIDSKIGSLGNAIQQIQNGQIVRPDVALQIATAAQDIVNTIKSAAQAKAQSFKSQATVAGLGSQWDQYIGGSNPSYGGNNTGGNNPLGI